MKHFKNFIYIFFILLISIVFYNFYYSTNFQLSEEFFFIFLIVLLFIFLVEPLIKIKIKSNKFNIILIIIYLYLSALTVRFSPTFFFIFFIPIISASLSFGMLGSGITVILIFFIQNLQNIGNTDYLFELENLLPKFITLFIISLISGLIFEENKKYEKRCFEKVNKIIKLNFLKTKITYNKSYNEIGKELYLALKNFFKSEKGICIYRSNHNYSLIIEDGIKINDLNEISIIININNSIIHKPYSFHKISTLKNIQSMMKLSIIYDNDKHFEIILFRNSRRFYNEELTLCKIIKNNIELLLSNKSLYNKNRNTSLFFNELIENIEYPILITDKDYNITTFNSSVKNLFLVKTFLNINFKNFLEGYLKTTDITELFDENENYFMNSYTISLSNFNILNIKFIKNCYIDITGDLKYIWTFYDLTSFKTNEYENIQHKLLYNLGEIIYYKPDLDEKENITALNYNEKLNIITKNIDNNVKLLDFNNIINNIISNFQNNYDNITFKTIISDKEIFVKLNELELNKVLNNIINNSIESIKKTGNIIIHIKKVVIAMIGRNKYYLELKIIDNGKGITKEDLEKLFEPFNTTKMNKLGTGLSISKRIIEKYNGKIEVESILNNGTTVIILLPVVQI